MTSEAVARSPLVSVVVPTRDKCERLRVVLAGLAVQVGVEMDLVVVDDGSTCDVAELAANAGARLVRLEGEGRAAARNAGAAAARHEVLVFVDDDIVVGPHFLEAHSTSHVVGVGPVVSHGPVAEFPRAQRFLDHLADATLEEIRIACESLLSGGVGRLFFNSLERAIGGMARGELPAIAPWLGFVGWNVSVDRQWFERAGGFDTAFGTSWGCEDIELGYRLHRLGIGSAFVPDAFGIHLSHYHGIGRWDEHAANLRFFGSLHPEAPIAALEILLGPSGDVAAFIAEAKRALVSGEDDA